MKKSILFMLGWSFVLVLSTVAQEKEEMELKPTPPPVSCLDFFKGTRQFTLTAMYAKLGAVEKYGMSGTPTGAGINIDISRGHADGFGTMFRFAGMGMNVPLKDPATDEMKKYPAWAFVFGGMMVLDLIKGEKRDIAGEIIAKKPTLALFAGFEEIISLFKMDDFMDSGYDFSVVTFDSGLPVGIAADIPLGFFMSLLPFGRYTWSHAKVMTTVPYMVTLHRPPYYQWMEGISRTVDQTRTRLDYGLDIDLRLFRNAPDWKISVGTVLSQISGMKEGNLIVMVSIKKESGKYYSSTMFGPKLH